MVKDLFSRKESKDYIKKNVVDWFECPITPMTSDFKLDEVGIQENIDAYADMNENGLVMGGFIAEAWNLNLSDWMRYHELVAKANNGRMHLSTIILDPGVHQAIEKMKFVEKLGYTMAEVINPIVQLKSDDEVFNYYKYMTDNTDLPIILYRTAVSGKVISPDLIKKLSEIDTITGVKMGTLNPTDITVLRQMVPDNFVVANPDEYWWLHDLRTGGQVLWGGFSHIVYGKKRVVLEEYTKLAREGRWEEARVKWESLQPVRDLMGKVFMANIVKTASYATATYHIKTWFEALGLKAGPMLPPVQPISNSEKEWLKSELKSIGVI